MPRFCHGFAANSKFKKGGLVFNSTVNGQKKFKIYYYLSITATSINQFFHGSIIKYCWGSFGEKSHTMVKIRAKVEARCTKFSHAKKNNNMSMCQEVPSNSVFTSYTIWSVFFRDYECAYTTSQLKKEFTIFRVIPYDSRYVLQFYSWLFCDWSLKEEIPVISTNKQQFCRYYYTILPSTQYFAMSLSM